MIYLELQHFGTKIKYIFIHHLSNIMKITLKISIVIFSIFLFSYCKEDRPTAPLITTRVVTEISTTTAISGGEVTNIGGAPLISNGVCWGTTTDPTIENNKTIESGGTISFSSNISQLSPNTTYYVRAYATNSTGIGYGESVSFKTLGDKPLSDAINVSNIQLSSATINGTIYPNSLSTVITIEYGLATNYGNSITPSQSPVTGSATVNMSANLSGLAPGTTYHFRIKTENSLGLTYSSDLSFTTLGNAPSYSAQPVANVGSSTVTLSGSVNPNYLTTTVIFEYGIDSNYGSTIAAIQSPINGSTEVNVSANLTGLTEYTFFHYRLKAENILGISTTNDKTFLTAGVLTDVDGNTYKAVLIGNQKWMAENLRTKHFSDGVPILNGESVSNNCASTIPYYFNYNQDPSNTLIYGLLYNYYAVSGSHSIEPQSSSSIPSGIQGACPTGWHIPSFPEMEILINTLGGQQIAGGNLKSTQLWNSPNVGATNSSNFNALPAGGYEKLNFNYGFLGQTTFIWSTSTPLGDTDDFRGIYLIYSSQNAPLSFAAHRCSGNSIRCLKD